MSKKPVRVAVTGAAGQIGYALLFRIASGEMLGKDQPVILQLLEVPVEGCGDDAGLACELAHGGAGGATARPRLAPPCKTPPTTKPGANSRRSRPAGPLTAPGN